MIRKLFRYNGGLKLPENKEQTTHRPIQPASIPPRLVIPVQQHIGAPAEPAVKIGDYVLKGQMIAKGSGLISAPVHASSSGIVVDIGDYPVPHPSGLTATCVVIEPDGLDALADHLPPIHDCTLHTPEEIRERIHQAGIVGLGGAGFPSHVKLAPKQQHLVDILLLNGAECEPYITCDDMLMRERPEEILKGMMVMRYALMAKRCIIGIEDNKPLAAKALRAAITHLALTDVEVIEVPSLYPNGGEKQLIRVLTGIEIPANRLPIDFRIVCQNVGTAYAVARAVHHGEPLISRIITVTGAVGSPCNLEVPFGILASELISQCAGTLDHIDRIIMGGPMMGFALPNADVPVVKITNCLLALNDNIIPLPHKNRALPCIRCGSCATVCPVNLLPQQLYWHARAKDFDKTQDYRLFDCIECGCCEYVCPSQIPLVQYFRYAKGQIWDQEREKKKADIARERHESRQARLEREKEEKAARHKAKAAAVTEETSGNDEKKAAIQAALERVKAKQSAPEQADGNPPE